MKKIRLPPNGFLSYARQDDDLDGKKLSRLRELIKKELQLHYGRESVMLFQDVSTIPHGAAWERETLDALNETSFFIPIITPNFIQSEWCSRETRIFLDRERQLVDLYRGLPPRRCIFPIDYRRIRDRSACDPAALAALRERQWCDYQELRDKDPDGEAVSRAISRFTESICDLLMIEVEAPLTPEEVAAERKKAEAAKRKAVRAVRAEEKRRAAEEEEAERREQAEARRREEVAQAERESARTVARNRREETERQAEEAERRRAAMEVPNAQAREDERKRREMAKAEASERWARFREAANPILRRLAGPSALVLVVSLVVAAILVNAGTTVPPVSPAPDDPKPACANVFSAAGFANRPSRPAAETQRIVIGPGRTLAWNDQRTVQDRIRDYLEIAGSLQAVVVRVVPGADPAFVQSVRTMIGQSLDCRAAF